MFQPDDMRSSLQGEDAETQALCEEDALPQQPNSAPSVSRRRALLASVALLGCVIGALAYSTYSKDAKSMQSHKILSKTDAIALFEKLPPHAPFREASYTPQVTCYDQPNNWYDLDNQNCGDYHHRHFCTPYQKVGYGWNEAWGTIPHFAVAGVDAYKACCSCGGGSTPAPTHPPGGAQCADGYTVSHYGWWDNWHQLHPPYGRIKHAHFVSSAECAAECTKTFGCSGYTLFQNQVCWLYNSFGAHVNEQRSLACISNHRGIPPGGTPAPGATPGTTLAPPPKPPLPRTAAGTGRFPADVMTCGVRAAMTTAFMDCNLKQTGLYEQVSRRVQKMVTDLPEHCGQDCPVAAFAGCVLRAASHDFMDYKAGVGGGSDGCIDFQNPDNRGLETCLVSGYNASAVGNGDRGLIDAYQDFCDRVSLADFLVIAAEGVIIATRRLALDTKFDTHYQPLQASGSLGDNLPSGSFSPLGLDLSNGFKFGRTTKTECPTCAAGVTGYCNQPLPNAELGCPENQRVFIDNMGLRWDEIVAIMGVRTLGYAEPDGSGLKGWRSDPQNSARFNNNYYISLAMKGWIPQELPPDAANGRPFAKYQWQRTDDFKYPQLPEMMYDTDMCLAHNSDVASVEFRKTGVTGGKFCCNWWHNQRSALCGAVSSVSVDGSPYSSKCCTGGVNQTYLSCEAANSELTGPAGVLGQNGSAGAAVELYAFNEFKWLQDFEAVWRKATEFGYSDLTNLTSPSGKVCNDGHQRDWRAHGQGA